MAGSKEKFIGFEEFLTSIETNIIDFIQKEFSGEYLKQKYYKDSLEDSGTEYIINYASYLIYYYVTRYYQPNIEGEFKIDDEKIKEFISQFKAFCQKLAKQPPTETDPEEITKEENKSNWSDFIDKLGQDDVIVKIIQRVNASLSKFDKLEDGKTYKTIQYISERADKIINQFLSGNYKTSMEILDMLLNNYKQDIGAIQEILKDRFYVKLVGSIKKSKDGKVTIKDKEINLIDKIAEVIQDSAGESGSLLKEFYNTIIDDIVNNFKKNIQKKVTS